MLRYRTTVTPGEGLDFVISDDTKDRHGTRINPSGWQFGDYVPVLFGHDGIPVGLWENLRVEKGKLLGRLKLGREGSSDRIDEIRSLVDQGILRAVSAGFEVHDYGKPEKGGFDFERQTLMEASLVAVPSNPNALAQARALELAFGEHAEKPARALNGGHAATSPKKAIKMEPIGPQIESAQNSLNAARDALAAHLALNTDDIAQTEALTGEIEQRQSRLDSLQRAEKALGARAANGGGEAKLPAPVVVRQPLAKRDTRPVTGMDLLVRAAVVKTRAYALQKDPIRILEDSYGDHEATQVFVRAAIAGATTTTAGWAAELVQQANVDFLESLRPIGVFPRLAAQGTQLSFGPGAGSFKIPSRATTPSISGAFVAEGGAIPVRRLGLTSIPLVPHKMGVISVFTREIARYSNPQIEGLLRSEIMADTALTIDSLLLDAVAGSTTRPAGLINGVTVITASVLGGYKAILADIQALAAPYDTANAGRNLVLMMNPREARALAMSPGPDGTFGWTTAFMGEFTVIVSTTITAGKLVMVDAADLVSVNGTPEFEVSEHTVLHMEDTTPGTDISTATPSQSMFQTASLALRMLLDITWAMRRTGMVQFITGASWAPL
jgi:HK97 family phage major capsid protein